MKRLLTTLKDKWPEYLLEILVLIIGIYGAFALENWNEGRKEHRREIELLSNLKSDFEIRLNEMQDIQRVRADMIRAIDTIYLVANEKGIMPSDDRMDFLLSHLYISYRFNEEFSALDMLFSTGGINDLSNDDLKEKLIEWPWAIQEMIEEQDRIENQLLDLQEVMADYVVAHKLMKQFPSQGISMVGELKEDYFDSDYIGLLQNRQFMDRVAHKRAYLVYNLVDGQHIIDLGYKIVSLIENEINAE